MKLTLSEIAGICQGLLYNSLGTEIVSGVTIDSRQVKPGDLYVPIKGEKFDGHQFIAAAGKNGAVAAFCEQQQADLVQDLNLPVIIVESALQAMQELAAWYLKQTKARVVAITGSVGKTSTKDMVAAVLQTKFKVLANKGNLNTEIGLPLTLFALKPEVDYAVLEMGMRGPGQITELTEIAPPFIGVLINVGESHIELLGSQEAIATAKGELLAALPAQGWAILNGDDPLVRSQSSRSAAPLIYYGFSSQADLQVTATDLEQLSDGRVRFMLKIGSEQTLVTLAAPGQHNVKNALAAAAVGYSLGLTGSEIAFGLSQVDLTPMRCQVLETPRGYRVINDTYNACYDSMRAGLDLLASLKEEGNRSIAVLGDMLELGDNCIPAHRRVGQYVVESGVDYLITVGTRSRQIANGAVSNGLLTDHVRSVPDTDSAVEVLRSLVQATDVILVKGSRSMQMEKVVAAMVGESSNEY